MTDVGRTSESVEQMLKTLAFGGFMVAGYGGAMALGASPAVAGVVGWVAALSWVFSDSWRHYRALRADRYRSYVEQFRRNDPETGSQVLTIGEGHGASAASEDPNADVARL